MYTLQEKTWSTRHTLFTLDQHRLPDHTSHVVHIGNLSLVLMRSKQAPTLGRSLGDRRQTGPPIVLGHHISPLPRQPWSRGERFQPNGYIATLSYWVHIPACDLYIQYLLVGANPSILNRYRRGLQPWRCRLSTYHSPIFPTNGLHFPPKGPIRSQVIHPIITKWSREGINPKSHEWEPPLDFYRKLSSKHSMC
jgi:hypothetical protein